MTLLNNKSKRERTRKLSYTKELDKETMRDDTLDVTCSDVNSAVGRKGGYVQIITSVEALVRRALELIADNLSLGIKAITFCKFPTSVVFHVGTFIGWALECFHLSETDKKQNAPAVWPNCLLVHEPHPPSSATLSVGFLRRWNGRR